MAISTIHIARDQVYGIQAGADFRLLQWRCIKHLSGLAYLAEDGDTPLGVLQDAPDQFEMANYVPHGFSMVLLGETVLENTKVGPLSDGRFGGSSSSPIATVIEGGSEGDLVRAWVDAGGLGGGTGPSPTIRAPEEVPVASHGVASVDEPFPIAVDLEDGSPTNGEYVIGTRPLQGSGKLNDPMLRNLSHFCIGIKDAQTLLAWPVSWTDDLPEQEFPNAAFEAKSVYWWQDDGTVGLDPGTNRVRLWRANTATKVDFYPDVLVVGTQPGGGSGAVGNFIAYAGGLTLKSNLDSQHPASMSFREYLQSGDGKFIDIIIEAGVLGSVALSELGGSGIVRRMGPVDDFMVIAGTTYLIPGLYRIQQSADVNYLDLLVDYSSGWGDINAAGAAGGLWQYSTRPLYVDSLDQNNRTLSLPMNMPDDPKHLQQIYLRGNSLGFKWDLSNYNFPDNDDGTPFTPGESATTAKVDRMTVQRRGDMYWATWERGFAHWEEA